MGGPGRRTGKARISPTLGTEETLQAGFRYAFALTHHHHDAEDLVQTAWLRLHRRGHACPTKALLFTTIRNLHVDNYRRRQRVRFSSLDAAEKTEPVRDEREPEAEDELIDQLLLRLREAEREALFLHVVAGYSAEEIATLTGKPRGTVLSLMHRGRQKLQALAAAGKTGFLAP